MHSLCCVVQGDILSGFLVLSVKNNPWGKMMTVDLSTCPRIHVVGSPVSMTHSSYKDSYIGPFKAGL